MPDITYKREFVHAPFIEFKDPVSATNPEKGFNSIFNRIEDEFDAISKVVDALNKKINKMQRAEIVSDHNKVTVQANSVLVEPVEIFDRGELPANGVKVHYVKIFHVSGSQKFHTTFNYEFLDNNKTKVTLFIVNSGENATEINYHVVGEIKLVEPQPLS